MTGEYGYIVRLLRRLETMLIESGHQAEGGRLGQITQRISRADDARAALATLYSVEGYDRFALRLLYYGEKMRETLVELPEERLLDYQIHELYAVLLSSSRGLNSLPEEPQPTPPPAKGNMEKAVEAFSTSMQDLRRTSFHQEEFAGIRRAQVDELRARLEDLHRAAKERGNADVARFATACSTFLAFVVDRKLLQDVRVVNILDNAGLTLQTVLQAVGADDYDSLHQMVQLLEDPATLLE
jgi:hypothetical protein